MYYKNTIELIYANLSEVQNRVATFGSEEKIHTIDIDLVLSKMRSTYDLLLSLKGELPAQDLSSNSDLFEVEEEKKLEENVEDVMPVKEIVDSPDDEQVKVERFADEEQTPKESPEPTAKSKNIAENIKQEFSAESREVLSSSRTAVGKAGKVIGEKLVSDKSSLNEELSRATGLDDLTAKLQSKPISSVSGAIGLNEKFELINNLFDGDSEKYNNAMQVLNMATNFNEAYNYLKETFRWEMDDIYVQRILELIRRKLIVNKNEQ